MNSFINEKDGGPPYNSLCEYKLGHKFHLLLQEIASILNSVKYHWLFCSNFV